MCWIYILQSGIAWVWKCGCFLGWGERWKWGYLHLKEERWKQYVFLSVSEYWKLAQTDVRHFQWVCNQPALPKMGELQSCNCPAMRAGAWQIFCLNWRWLVPFDSFMILIPPSFLPVPQGTRTNETYWRRGPWKFRKIRMVLSGLFVSVHVQDSPPSLSEVRVFCNPGGGK